MHRPAHIADAAETRGDDAGGRADGQAAGDKSSHTGRFLARVLGNGKKREAA